MTFLCPFSYHFCLFSTFSYSFPSFFLPLLTFFFQLALKKAHDDRDEALRAVARLEQTNSSLLQQLDLLKAAADERDREKETLVASLRKEADKVPAEIMIQQTLRVELDEKSRRISTIELELEERLEDLVQRDELIGNLQRENKQCAQWILYVL